MNIAIPEQQLAAFCHRYGIHSLSIFGSALRPDFNEDSDIDILVEFEPDHTPGLFTIARMERELSAMLGGRKVDLRTPNDLSRYFRQQVLKMQKSNIQQDDLIRLQHMLDAAQEAIGFAVGKNRIDLEDDRMLVLSLVKDIEIVGEAAYQTSRGNQAENPDIPWDDIIRMRHRLVHAYYEIDLDILWRTVQDDLPILVTQLTGLI